MDSRQELPQSVEYKLPMINAMLMSAFSFLPSGDFDHRCLKHHTPALPNAIPIEIGIVVSGFAMLLPAVDSCKEDS